MNEIYEYPIYLRWSDADSNGHINNARFATFAEDARIRWFAEMLKVGGDMATSLILARQEIDYIRQVVVDEEQGRQMTMRCSAVSIGRTSTRIHEELWGAGDTDRPAAIVECVLVHFDYDAGTTAPWSDAHREIIGRYLREEA